MQITHNRIITIYILCNLQPITKQIPWKGRATTFPENKHNYENKYVVSVLLYWKTNKCRRSGWWETYDNELSMKNILQWSLWIMDKWRKHDTLFFCISYRYPNLLIKCFFCTFHGKSNLWNFVVQPSLKLTNTVQSLWLTQNSYTRFIQKVTCLLK